MGRVARFELALGRSAGEGLVVIYKQPAGFDVVAVDADGRERTDWAEAIRNERPLRARRVSDTAEDDRWTVMVRRLAARLEPGRRPHAVAAIVVKPQT